MATISRAHLLTWLLVMLVAFIFSACDGGSSEDELDASSLRPIITGLSTHSANVGDPVQIFGSNFGRTQTGGSVQLSGLEFIITGWQENLIDAQVVAGMASGIIVITINGIPSQSGTEAQLYVGEPVPEGDPIINGISPTYGRIAQDEILISGVNFGTEIGTSTVWFSTSERETSQKRSSAAPAVYFDGTNWWAKLGVDSTITLPGDEGPEEQPLIRQWNDGLIRVLVPLEAIAGFLRVEVNSKLSNVVSFDAQPPPAGVLDPAVTEVHAYLNDELQPTFSGPAGTVVELIGENFGFQQGTSTIRINGAEAGWLALEVTSWANNRITAMIPEGAATGPIELYIGAKRVLTDIFTVAAPPEITGLSPSAMKIGQPLTVYGKYFGDPDPLLDPPTEPPTLKVGSTNVTVDAWTATTISVNILPKIIADPEDVLVQVTAGNGLQSNIFHGRLESDLEATITVEPEAGVANVTSFKFYINVAGGTGNYEYTLIPDATNPSVTDPTRTSSPVSHTYTDEGTFDTKMQISDTQTGDTLIANGPEVLVVGENDPVITSMALADFNKGLQDAPNNYCFVFDLELNEIYHDFTFIGNDIIFASAFSEEESGGSPVEGITRDISQFMVDGENQRAYGYRYMSGNGSIVRLDGLNFGADKGHVYLNSEGGGTGLELIDEDVLTWEDALIEFRLPEGQNESLSGTIAVLTTGGGEFVSQQQLICSPYVTNILPETVEMDGTLVVTGQDFKPPQIPGITGPQTYMIWMVEATYTNPFTNPPQLETELVLRVNPILIDPTATNITFNMSELGPTCDVEVFNASNDQAEIVTGTLQNDTTYYFFLWSGALSGASNRNLALSGIFSEAYPVEVGMGGPTTYSISGTVTDFDTAAPLEDIKMDLGGAAVDTVYTAADGTYAFTGLADGAYTVTLDPEGAPYTIHPSDSQDALVAGADVTGIDFEVEGAPPPP